MWQWSKSQSPTSFLFHTSRTLRAIPLAFGWLCYTHTPIMEPLYRALQRKEIGSMISQFKGLVAKYGHFHSWPGYMCIIHEELATLITEIHYKTNATLFHLHQCYHTQPSLRKKPGNEKPILLAVTVLVLNIWEWSIEHCSLDYYQRYSEWYIMSATPFYSFLPPV